MATATSPENVQMAALAHEKLHRKIEELERQVETSRNTIASLEENVDRYRGLVDSASDLIHSVTPAGAFLYVNRAWRQALGYSEEDIKSLSLMDIVDEGCRDKCRTIFKSLIHGETLDRNETVFVAKDGTRIRVEGRCSTRFKEGRAVAMVGIFRDISERAKNEKALRESEKRYRDLFENAHDLIQIIRPDGRLLYVNRAWRQTFGYSEEEIAAGLTIFNLISPDCHQHCEATFRKVLAEEKVNYINTVFVAKDGSRLIIDGNAICKFEDGKPLYTQCIFRDVTEKKKMEEELLKAQKLESVGVFAGGIAHDFNNLLTAILGNISVAKLYLNPGDDVFKRLAETEKATLRARSLTQQLLTFSKGGAPIKKTTTINELLKDCSSFALRGSNVRCDYLLADDLWPVEVDEGQLSQVTQNLVINAAQAMADGGIVTVAAANLELADGFLPTLNRGRYIRITVKDHGPGIPREHLPRIFDPYFTSKESGSGLGLAIAYAIISKHDGLITVASEPGQGATFSIYLPASDKAMAAADGTDEKIRVSTGKVLVMDDEEMVRMVACEMLKHIGCETEEARDGQEAIDRYREALKQGKPFDAVIMDLTIPGGLGGKETVGRLKSLDPGVRVVVSSGYANDPIMANFRQYGFSGVVPKPYSILDLSRAMSSLLRAEPLSA
ncbi:MAG: PAS domain S-box protein [Desulfobulbaceae bacterium]|nr:PAS domain S-box protein [Desulfobulbaceae bacterium]